LHHEVSVPCNCGDIEHCRLERYISDVRILERELRMNEYVMAALLGAAGALVAAIVLIVVWLIFRGPARG
jgi:hypothetical protein